MTQKLLENFHFETECIAYLKYFFLLLHNKCDKVLMSAFMSLISQIFKIEGSKSL